MPGRGTSSPPPLRALLAVAALSPLVGAACAPGPSFGGGGGAASEAGAAALAERLPVVAAGFRRGESRPIGAAGAGREVAYATGGGRSTGAATVELLPEGTGAEAALDAALAELSRAGPAREVREAGRFTLSAGSPGGAAPRPALLCAETAGRYGRERVAGLVCTGRAGPALLRIRVAMPLREAPPADPRAFAEAIAAAAFSGAALARSG
jgi:hypothetical protein